MGTIGRHIPVGRYFRYRPTAIEDWLREHGAWYGRWRTPDGRRLSRKLGPVGTPLTADWPSPGAGGGASRPLTSA